MILEDSEASASELLQNNKEMLPQYYVDGEEIKIFSERVKINFIYSVIQSLCTESGQKVSNG